MIQVLPLDCITVQQLTKKMITKNNKLKEKNKNQDFKLGETKRPTNSGKNMLKK